MKILLPLFILVFALQSCGNETQKATRASNSENPPQTSADVSELTSRLRPNERLELRKIYTDTIDFIEFNDYGDEPLIFINKNKDTVSLIYDWALEYDFVRGDELEIQWKMDSIRYAGDSEFLDYTAFLISAKKLNPLNLTDKNVKFLWREMQYVEDLKGEFNVIALDEAYIKTISEPEKAALAYIATFIGNECAWDGNINESRSNLKCKILWALDLGYQCSSKHLDLLRFWFRNNENILKELENCPTTPEGATLQDTFDEIDLEVKGNMITVSFKANGINVREQKSWNWTEKHFFEFNDNELLLIKKDISPMVYGKFEVSGLLLTQPVKMGV